MSNRFCSKCGGNGPFPPTGERCNVCVARRKAQARAYYRRHKEEYARRRRERSLSDAQIFVSRPFIEYEGTMQFHPSVKYLVGTEYITGSELMTDEEEEIERIMREEPYLYFLLQTETE